MPTSLKAAFYNKLIYVCICMNILGVVVLELDSHPDHDKGPDRAPSVCPKTHPIIH